MASEPELSEPFADRTIYIIPDNDEPGTSMRSVLRNICTA